MDAYLPIFLFIFAAIALGLLLLIIGLVISKKVQNTSKLTPFECGFDEFEDAREPFDVRFYLVAILFILFDLEIAFFFPWILAKSELGLYGLISIGLFLFILIVGFAYEWKKGALEWK